MISMLPPDTQFRPFGYLAWSGAAGLVLALMIAVAAALVGKPDMLYMENGPLENMTLALWLMSAFVGAVAYRRWTGRMDRVTTAWVALVSCLAMLREADFHTLLHPNTLGRFGIRFRIDWVLDPRTGIVLKVVCILFFLAFIGAIVGPLLFMHARFWQLVRAGDSSIGMLVLGFAGTGVGFIMDEVLRNSPLISKAARVLIEESGEMLGALAFLAGSLLLCKSPVSRRLDRIAAGTSAIADPTATGNRVAGSGS